MHTLVASRIPSSDPRLGRHVLHDSRSLHYAYEADESAIASARWTREVPVFDQGQVGSCTANAAVGVLGTGPFWGPTSQQVFGSMGAADIESKVVLPFYSDEEVADGDGPYPPQDNGSTGLTAAKVAQRRGWITGYQHALSLEAVLTALSRQPVIVGTEWLKDMFEPTPDGQLRVSGASQGGHEYLLDQNDTAAEKVWMQNSWGTAWGKAGRAWISYADLSTLLAARGDCTVFALPGAPAPTPTPTPAPVGAYATFKTAAEGWLAHRHSGINADFAEATREFLAAQG